MAIDAKTTLSAAFAVAALMVGAPAQAAEPAISEQPADTARADITTMEWVGGSEAPNVFVEYRHGLSWLAVARDDAEFLVLTDEGDEVWSAQWLPALDSPSGTYRMRVEGSDYTLVSDEFEVKPCKCVIPHPLRVRWRDGAWRLRLTAEYQSRTLAGVRLSPRSVKTGRPVVRVMRDGRRIGSVRLRYKRGAFRASWRGRGWPRNSVVFELVSLTDGFGNR